MSKKAKKSRATSTNDLYREKATKSDLEKSLYIELPVSPSVNTMYVTSRRGGKHLSRDAEQWFNVARARIYESVDNQKWKAEIGSKWLYLDLAFFFPDKRIRDSHNCLKILMDAIEKACFDNDYYVCPRIQIVEYDKLLPRIEGVLTYQSEDERQEWIKSFETMRDERHNPSGKQKIFE